MLTRISNRTGVPVDTLRKQEAETGLGFGDLEKANLLAKASGHSFREVVSRFKAGEGWGEIAHDAGLNLGKIVSEAHRSDNAAQHGRDEEARDEQDRDEQGRDERVRDERAHDEKGHAQNVATAEGHRRVLTRISNQTGVPARRLTRQKAKTGLGFGALEKANLLAKATGRSFRRVVSTFRSGEGFGKIAHNAGLNLGKLVSRAHRSDKAAQNARKNHPQNAHRKSAVAHGKSAVARGKNRLQRPSAAAHGKRAVAHGNNRLQRASAVARGNNSFQRASAFSQGRGNMGTMNGFGRSRFTPARGGAGHGMGHGHGGGR